MNNNEEEEEEDVVELIPADTVLAPGLEWHESGHRGRKLRMAIPTLNQAGLDQLTGQMSVAGLVSFVRNYYVARNTILSQLDREDGKDFKGERKLPEKGDETLVVFNLVDIIPVPGKKRTKWGVLKPYVESAKTNIAAKKYPMTEENIRKVAEFLKKQAEQSTDITSLLG